MLGSDLSRTPAHCLPDAERCCVHIKQPRMLAVVTMTRVNADGRKDAHLTCRHQKSAHADCRSVLSILHFNRILRDDSVVRTFGEELGENLKGKVVRACRIDWIKL